MLPILFGVLAGFQVNPVQATQDVWPACSTWRQTMC
jgi:hypothetical protein